MLTAVTCWQHLADGIFTHGTLRSPVGFVAKLPTLLVRLQSHGCEAVCCACGSCVRCTCLLWLRAVVSRWAARNWSVQNSLRHWLRRSHRLPLALRGEASSLSHLAPVYNGKPKRAMSELCSLSCTIFFFFPWQCARSGKGGSSERQ